MIHFLLVKVTVRYLSVVGCLNPDLAGNVAIVVIHHHSLEYATTKIKSDPINQLIKSVLESGSKSRSRMTLSI
jgi:hypothetical protein